MEDDVTMLTDEDIARQALADTLARIIHADDWATFIDARCAVDTLAMDAAGIAPMVRQ